MFKRKDRLYISKNTIQVLLEKYKNKDFTIINTRLDKNGIGIYTLEFDYISEKDGKLHYRKQDVYLEYVHDGKFYAKVIEI